MSFKINKKILKLCLLPSIAITLQKRGVNMVVHLINQVYCQIHFSFKLPQLSNRKNKLKIKMTAMTITKKGGQKTCAWKSLNIPSFKK